MKPRQHAFAQQLVTWLRAPCPSPYLSFAAHTTCKDLRCCFPAAKVRPSCAYGDNTCTCTYTDASSDIESDCIMRALDRGVITVLLCVSFSSSLSCTPRMMYIPDNSDTAPYVRTVILRTVSAADLILGHLLPPARQQKNGLSSHICCGIAGHGCNGSKCECDRSCKRRGERLR